MEKSSNNLKYTICILVQNFSSSQSFFKLSSSRHRLFIPRILFVVLCCKYKTSYLPSPHFSEWILVMKGKFSKIIARYLGEYESIFMDKDFYLPIFHSILHLHLFIKIIIIPAMAASTQ